MSGTTLNGTMRNAFVLCVKIYYCRTCIAVGIRNTTHLDRQHNHRFGVYVTETVHNAFTTGNPFWGGDYLEFA